MIPISQAASASDVNAALFCDFDNTGFIEPSLSPFLERPGCFVVTDNPSLLARVPANRRLAAQLPEHLVDGARVVLVEVGSGQAPFAADLLREALGGGDDLDPRTHRDLGGTRRVVEVRQGY